jgi:predicted peroxiredoxin
MADTLAIMVSTKESLPHLLGLVAAAAKRDVEVRIFFSGEGVLVTQEPHYAELVGRAKMSLCEVSFRALGLEGDVPGIGYKDFATQARHAEMLEDYPHYLVL